MIRILATVLVVATAVMADYGNGGYGHGGHGGHSGHTGHHGDQGGHGGAYGHVGGHGGHSGHGGHGGHDGGYGKNNNYAPAYYGFEYGVHDPYYGANFGHKEQRDGHVTKGSYYVNLPDGRLQKVSYTADKYGYHPIVTYEGVAQFPETKSYHGSHHGGHGGYHK